MRHLYLLALPLLFSCGNKKAEIVEEIKKTKNDLAESEMKHGWIKSAAEQLSNYHRLTESSKEHNSKQMAADAQVYKDAYEMSVKQLKGVSPDILKDQKKLDSMAFNYERNSTDLKSRIDSLELELKKY